MDRFPEFYVQLTMNEANAALTQRRHPFKVTNCDRNKFGKSIKYRPFAFTEHGILMLSSVLKSGLSSASEHSNHANLCSVARSARGDAELYGD